MPASGATRATRRVEDTPRFRVREVDVGLAEDGRAVDELAPGAPRRNEELRHAREGATGRGPPDAGAASPSAAASALAVCRRAPRVHQRLDLRAGQRPAQVGQRPARLEHLGRVLVDVVEQEHAAAEPGQGLLHLPPVEPLRRARGRALEPLEHARLVALGLEPAEEPGAGVREPLVVEVHRVLRREHDAEAERAPLLQQRQERRLRRRRGDRREVTRRSRPCRGSPAGSSCPTAPASRRASG